MVLNVKSSQPTLRRSGACEAGTLQTTVQGVLFLDEKHFLLSLFSSYLQLKLPTNQKRQRHHEGVKVAYVQCHYYCNVSPQNLHTLQKFNRCLKTYSVSNASWLCFPRTVALRKSEKWSTEPRPESIDEWERFRGGVFGSKTSLKRKHKMSMTIPTQAPAKFLPVWTTLRRTLWKAHPYRERQSSIRRNASWNHQNKTQVTRRT